MMKVEDVNILLAKLGSYGVYNCRTKRFFLAFRKNCKTSRLGRKLDPAKCLTNENQYDVEINVMQTQDWQFTNYIIYINEIKRKEYNLFPVYKGTTLAELRTHLNLIFNNPEQLK